MPETAPRFARCVKCRRRYGWFGPYARQPDCPECGHRPDPEFGALIDEALERIASDHRTEARQREAARR